MQRVAAGLSWSKSQPARVTSGTTASPQSADTMLRDAAFQASQEYADAVSWLAKTTVSIEDDSAHLGRLPRHAYTTSWTNAGEGPSPGQRSQTAWKHGPGVVRLSKPNAIA